MNFALIREIVQGRWMLSEDAALMYAPIIERMLNGDSVDLSMAVSQEEDSITGYSDANIDQVVAVLPVKGVITKEDFCGEMGTKTRDAKLKEFDADPSVGVVILDMDTPGGSAAYLQNIAETISNMSKPVIAYYSSVCASAGYYMASRTNMIFASSKADVVGSIGTMIQLVGPNPSKEKDNNYLIHTIYAKKSTDKNKPFEDALQGKYDLLRSTMLDPHNEFFIDSVKSGRPDIDESVLTGKTYYAEEAIQLGMIDGIKSFEEVVQFAFDLIKNQNSDNMKIKQLFKKPNMKKMEKISAILGRDVTQGEQLSTEDMEKVEAAMAAEPSNKSTEETTDSPTAQTSNEELSEMISNSVQTAVTGSVEPINAKLAEIENRLNAFEGKPGAEASTTVPGQEQKSKGDSDILDWKDPNAKANKQINNLLDEHGIG